MKQPGDSNGTLQRLLFTGLKRLLQAGFTDPEKTISDSGHLFVKRT